MQIWINFQDIPAWRHAVTELLARTLTAYDGPVIAPMTLVNEDYYREIIGTLRTDGFEVHHFALLARPATVARRLRARSRRGVRKYRRKAVA
jgi:hypothetical protein